MDWLQGGAGVLAGVVGARAIPQMILGASNTGAMGYAANAAAAAGLGWLAHMFFPRSRVLTASVIAGGFAGLIARIISDKTSYGQYLSLTGIGDYGMGLYLKSNFPNPPRLTDPGQAAFNWGPAADIPQYAISGSAGEDSYSQC